MIWQTKWHPGESKLLVFLRTPLQAEEAIWVVWFAFFWGALLGYVASLGELEDFFKRHPEMAFKMEPGMYRFFDLGTWVRESARVFGGNLLIFAPFSLLALRYPKLALYGLSALVGKAGLMAAPYNQLVVNLVPYTLILVVTALGELAAYALGLSGKWAMGLLLLFVWALLETYLIYWGL